MIKKIAQVLACALFGFALASLIAFLITRICHANPGACPFQNCEECDGSLYGMILGPFLAPPIAFLLYGAVGLFIVGKQVEKRRALAMLAGLSVLMVFAAQTAYMCFLIERSGALYANREIQADSEYAPPVLSKEEIQAYQKESSGLRPLFMVKQWERCALGNVDEKDALVSINCKKGDGWIKRADASKLIKLPMP